MYAAQKGYLDIVNTLLKNQKVEIDKPANNGATALMLAVYNNHPNIVEALLEKGADPHKKNKKGKTALELSIESNHLDTAKALIKSAKKNNTKFFSGGLFTFITHPVTTIKNLIYSSRIQEAEQLLKKKELSLTISENKAKQTVMSEIYEANCDRLLNNTQAPTIIKSKVKINSGNAQQKAASTPEQRKPQL